MASGIGALTNPNKLANTFRSEKKSATSYDTIKNYIDYLCDSFLVEIIIAGEESPVTRDETGITTISIYDFLLKDNSLEL